MRFAISPPFLRSTARAGSTSRPNTSPTSAPSPLSENLVQTRTRTAALPPLPAAPTTPLPPRPPPPPPLVHPAPTLAPGPTGPKTTPAPTLAQPPSGATRALELAPIDHSSALGPTRRGGSSNARVRRVPLRSSSRPRRPSTFPGRSRRGAFCGCETFSRRARGRR